jgi:hypothetical protein
MISLISKILNFSFLILHRQIRLSPLKEASGFRDDMAMNLQKKSNSAKKFKKPLKKSVSAQEFGPSILV